MGRIMGYYNPKWLAAFGVISSIMNAAATPLFGFLFAKLLFVMMSF